MKKAIIIIWIILWLVLINIFSINSYYNNFKWEESYENKNFSWALNIFKNEKNYIWLYNLWNTNYRLWEQSLPLQRGDLEGAMQYWKKSVDFYKNSLKLKYDPRTEYNYNFIKEKLKKLKKKQEEEKKREEQKNNKSAGQQGTSAPWNKSKPQLSEEAKKQLKAYEEKLKQDQKKNAWNFWKVYQENNRNDIFDNFNSFFEDDNLFDNSVLNNKDDKKDW